MADRFWVGGTATWNGTAGSKWSTTSGGGSGAAAPTNVDDVYIDANSTGTIGTSAAACICRSLTISSSSAATLQQTSTHNITVGDPAGTVNSSNVCVDIGSTARYSSSSTGVWTFVSTNSTPQSINFYGEQIGLFTFNGAGGAWILGSGVGTAGGGAWTLTAGSLDLNSQTVSMGSLAASNSNVRALTAGTAVVTLTQTGTIWTFQTSTNATVSLANMTLIVSDVSSTQKAITAGGAFVYGELIVTPNAGNNQQNVAVGNSSTWKNWSLANNTGGASFVFSNSQTKTFYGGKASLPRGVSGFPAMICTQTGATTATCTTLRNTVPIATDWVMMRDIVGAGLTPHYAGRNSTDLGNNTNFRFDTLETGFLGMF